MVLVTWFCVTSLLYVCKHETLFPIFTCCVTHLDKMTNSSVRAMNSNTCMSCVAMTTILPIMVAHTQLESLRQCKSPSLNSSAIASQQKCGGKKQSHAVCTFSSCGYFPGKHHCLTSPVSQGPDYGIISVLFTHMYHQQGRNCNPVYVPLCRKQPSLHCYRSFSGPRTLIVAFKASSFFLLQHICV